jgi:hypothetical protein
MGKIIYTEVNANTDGTGAWAETTMRSVSGQNIIGYYSSLTRLSNGGFGIYYYYRRVVMVTLNYDYVYSYTTNTAGNAGWVHVTITTSLLSTDNRIGVLGVDGLGIPFIARSNGLLALGLSTMTVHRGIDATGTALTVAATITFDLACTLAVPVRTRTVLLAGTYPAFAATCQDNRIFLVKSTTSSAVGPWTYEQVYSGSLTYSASDPTNAVSLHINGAGYPYIAFLEKVNATYTRAVILQSQSTTSFFFP